MLDQIVTFAQFAFFLCGIVAAASVAWASFTNKQADHGRRIDAHDKRFEAMEKRFEAMEVRVEDKFTRIETRLTEMHGLLATLAERTKGD
jgi:flagellar capping protein FliD